MSVDPHIAVLTTARSDFGLLKRVIQHAATDWRVSLLVAGSHFLKTRGETVREIEREFESHPKVELVRIDAMDSAGTPAAQVKSIAQTQLAASAWFANHSCDLLLFLGDRWELWGVTLPAFLHGIPMAHISGGEVTEGVLDDSVRHSHTKLASLHFAATEAYARNISLMGEEDWRISVVGECGLDLIYDAQIASPEEVKFEFGIDLSTPTLLVTFHPSTLDFQVPVPRQIDVLLNALSRITDHQIVLTAPGVEQGSDVVLDAINRFVSERPNAFYVEHFGSRNYLRVLGSAKAVVGNSSSGLVEASSFGVPAINIGDRQKNRLAADSVQHVGYDATEIYAAIRRAIEPAYQAYSKGCLNPYDPYRDGKNSWRIVQAIRQALTTSTREQLLVKKFDNQMQQSAWNSLLNKED